MPKRTIRKIRAFEAHGQVDKRNSWYWGVLLKKYGSYKKAEKAIYESRYMADAA